MKRDPLVVAFLTRIGIRALALGGMSAYVGIALWIAFHGH